MVNLFQKEEKNWEKEFSGFFFPIQVVDTSVVIPARVVIFFAFFAVFTFYLVPFRIYQKFFTGIIQYFVVRNSFQFLTPCPMHELE